MELLIHCCEWRCFLMPRCPQVLLGRWMLLCSLVRSTSAALSSLVTSKGQSRRVCSCEGQELFPSVPTLLLWFMPAKTLGSRSQNRLFWKRLLRSSSPTFEQTPPCQPDHGTEGHLQSSLKYFQGQWPQHLPGQRTPMSNHPFSEEILHDIQPKPPLAHLNTVSSPSCCLWEEADPHLATPSC